MSRPRPRWGPPPACRPSESLQGQTQGGQHKGRRCFNKGDAEVRPPNVHGADGGW